MRGRPLRNPIDGGRQHKPQRRLPADEYRRTGVLPAEHGSVVALRTRIGKPKPAWIRGNQPGPAGTGRTALEFEFSARRLSRHAGIRSAQSSRKFEESGIFGGPAARPARSPAEAKRAA